MTVDPKEQAASDAAAAATIEASTPANLSMEGKKTGSNSVRISDNEGSDSVSSRSSDDVKKFRKLREDGFTGKCWGIISFTPSRCRWDSEHPPQFSLGLNILFSFVCPFVSSIVLSKRSFASLENNNFVEKKSHSHSNHTHQLRNSVDSGHDPKN